MNCPVCGQALIVVERDSIEVDFCIECHGLWFDEGEIELLGEKAGVAIDLAAIENAAPSASSERYLKCPRCSKKMRKADLHRDASVLIVDFCPYQHGLWFDRGETGRFIGSGPAVESPATGVITRFLGETFDLSQGNKSEGA